VALTRNFLSLLAGGHAFAIRDGNASSGIIDLAGLIEESYGFLFNLRTAQGASIRQQSHENSLSLARNYYRQGFVSRDAAYYLEEARKWEWEGEGGDDDDEDEIERPQDSKIFISFKRAPIRDYLLTQEHLSGPKPRLLIGIDNIHIARAVLLSTCLCVFCDEHTY